MRLSSHESKDCHRELINTQVKVKKMIETDGQDDDDALSKLQAI